MGMQLIETIEVGSGGAASIEFTSIPQDGVDLLLVLSGRSESDGSSTTQNVSIQFNSSSSNFSYRYLQGSGSAASTGSGASAIAFLRLSGSASTANTFGNGQLYVSNYAGSSAKSFSVDGVSENNATTAYQSLSAQLWNDTSAITSITLAPQTGNFVQYSTASLYKIY